jgi:hypothetical protein
MTGPVDSARFFDLKGCLTAAGLAAFRNAPPGRAPAEVAAHVGSCGHCQQRLLSGLRGPAGAAAPPRASSGSRLGWLVALVVGGLLLLLAGLVALPGLAR